jgi:oxygen-independent coproporphyrinogen-3 oxidase
MNWHIPSPVDQLQFDPRDVFQAGLRLHHIANTAYPIGHVTTMAPYRVPHSGIHEFTPQAWEGIDQLSLYVHIPFCERRCGFCEYTVLDPHLNQSNEEQYFNLLAREFRLWRDAAHTSHKVLRGFDIGGGTPTSVNISRIARVISAAHRYFDLPPAVEISIETTPRIAALEPEKVRALYQLGVRRISMGVQSVNQALLKRVGRDASSLIFNQAAAANIREAGFQKFNLDLMYGFAYQTPANLEATLNHAVSLQPESITLYRMRYKGTQLAQQASHVTLNQINSETQLIHEFLHSASYQANPGKNTYSRLPGEPGTSHYLTERVVNGTPYLGLGLGAQSLSRHTLAYNAGAADKRLRLYAEKIQAGRLPIQDLYHLSLPAAIGKMVSISFYFGEINLASFARKFGRSLQQLFPEEWDFVLQNGLMHLTGETLQLTPKGVLHFSGVIALFYAGAVKAYLLELSASGQLNQHSAFNPPRAKHSQFAREMRG